MYYVTLVPGSVYKSHADPTVQRLGMGLLVHTRVVSGSAVCK